MASLFSHSLDSSGIKLLARLHHLKNSSTGSKLEYNLHVRDPFPKGPFHLLAPDMQLTLCGLPVTPVIIDRQIETSTLHLTSERPADSELCKECAQIELERILRKEAQ